MESNFELFDQCVKIIVTNSASDRKADRTGFISNQQACISIIHNFLKANVLDKKRINNLKDVLFQYILDEFATNGIFADYKDDHKCPEMHVEDYVNTVFSGAERFSVREAYTGNDGYDIWLATMGLLREMFILLDL